MRSKTKLQVKANNIDLQMFNMACNLEGFIGRLPTNDTRKYQLAELVSFIRSERHTVRRYMHPDDVERTKG